MTRIGHQKHASTDAGVADAGSGAGSKGIAKAKKPGPISRVKQLAITLSLLTVLGAQADIKRRPTEQIRGPKWLWRLVCLNVTGVFAYLRWGRKHAKSDG